MSTRELPARPNLEHLKNQATLLLREFLRSETAAIERFREAGVLTTIDSAKRADALHVIAREYGFETWANLKAHVQSLSEDPAVALTAAIKANDAALLRKVLARHPVLKSKINEPLPNYGFDEPALIAAVSKNNREMIDALLDAGANINERTRWWAGSFGVLDLGSPDLASYLIERGAHVDIHAAARLGMFDRLRELVEADAALVHARGGDGQTPLHFASSIEIAAYLLDHGAEIDVRDIDHESTPAQYMVAISPHRHDIARYLVSRGAQADILMAAALGDLERVRQCLDDDPESVRTTVYEKHFPKTNPDSGGTIYIFGFGWGKTAHMLAREFGHDEVFSLLMQRSPVWLRVAQACEVDDEPLAREVLSRHPDALRKMTPRAARRILWPALRNNTRAVHLMLDSGWPAEVRSDKDQTPLHWAAWHGNEAMVRDLLSRNAPVEAEEQEFKGTPLSWALHGSENSWHREKGDYPRTVAALLAAGATISKPLDEIEAPEEVMAVLHRHRGQVRAQSEPGS